jgi:hypothetical protein
MMRGLWDRDRFATLFRFTPSRSALLRKPSLPGIRGFFETLSFSLGQLVCRALPPHPCPRTRLLFSPYPEQRMRMLRIGGNVRSHALRFPNSISHVAGSTQHRGLPEPCFAALS